MNKNFRTYELAKEFYQECKKIKLNGAMKNQFERARFYFIAYGSLRETRTLLELSGFNELDPMADKLGAYIWKLAHNPGGS
ncbi:MAG: hypothetical protein CME65_04050 [Halobacteriovoraceae bacterium]|nr:hypothetical protein [Halobacteriovoraceae bacterium]|tara:strand:+ start:4159 stop:4401 length:243 start_codon:yes stop_codon:yes gene_type:complete